MSLHIAFIGLGTMGYPMAGHLAKAGHHVRVFNRSFAKMQSWLIEYAEFAEHPGELPQSPAQVAKNADIVITCVGNDDDVLSVLLGDSGVIETLKPGALVIDHTTTSAKLAEQVNQALTKAGISFIDAPVSGGQAGAQQGALTIMCGASESAFMQATPVLNHYAKAITHIGDVGTGQLAKMVNQISAIGAIAGLAEGMALAMRSGLDAKKVYQAIEQGAAGSWQMSNRYQTMLNGEFDFGFAIDWMQKDLGICLEHADALDLDLPLTEQIRAQYEALQEQGFGQEDTSALLRIYQADENSNNE